MKGGMSIDTVVLDEYWTVFSMFGRYIEPLVEMGTKAMWELLVETKIHIRYGPQVTLHTALGGLTSTAGSSGC